MPNMIGDYQVVERLGGGSMAELFLAQKVSAFGFIRHAVVKRVKRSRPDYQQLQEMLLDEARATACFDHPNLVSLFDVGETDQGVHLALEFVEGSDLRRVNARLRTRKEALPFELAAFITVEVLRGLHHAHVSKDEQGRSLEIVHRDVNPSNVLIARSGHVKLADFGVVRMRERVQQKTEPGLVKGKYAYLAPEYIAGEPCSVQTDVYAAGIMLFELLSGRECFSGKTAYEVMWKIVNKGVPMYRLEREGVPEDLQRIVQRATAMAPERRYQSAQDMANALEAWLMRSGRHATPWVLSVFFQRHELLPLEQESSKVLPLAHLGEVVDPKAKEARSSSWSGAPANINPGSPRVVDSSLTPLPPDVVAEMNQTALPPSFAAESDPPSLPTPLTPEPSPLQPPVSPAAAVASEPEPSGIPPRSPGPDPTSGLTDTLPSPGRDLALPSSPAFSPPTPGEPVRAEPSPRFGTPAADLGESASPPRFPPEAAAPSYGRRPRSEAKTEPVMAAAKSRPAPSKSPPAPKKTEPAPTAPRAPAVMTSLDPSNPPKSGKLEDVPAADVLECLNLGEHTGVVEFRCGLIWKKVKLHRGRPIGVTSNMGMELIGEHLVKSRVITRDQLHTALQRSERDGRALTAMLIEDGALEQSTLEDELGNNLGARLHEVLEWRWGTFELKAETVEPAEFTPRLDLDALLAHARAERVRQRQDSVDEDSGEFDPQRKLEKAVDMARSIASSSGKGQIERPWRPKEG